MYLPASRYLSDVFCHNLHMLKLMCLLMARHHPIRFRRQIINVTRAEHGEFPPSELNRQFRGSIILSLYFPFWIAKVRVSADLRTTHILMSAADNQHRAAEFFLQSQRHRSNLLCSPS